MSSFIEKATGPCVILAGAGTGKTSAIVSKVSQLILNKSYKPSDILCLTFSNEAARSMESRISSALESNSISGKPTVETFHALCSDMLKEHGGKIALSLDFRIIEPKDAMITLHKNLKIPAHLCDDFVSAISTAKDLGIAIEDYNHFLEEEKKNLPENIESELEEAQFNLRTLHARHAMTEKSALVSKVELLGVHLRRQKFLNAWRAYEKLKLKKNCQDYSDLNKNALELLQRFPNIAIWKYVVVDEFQDTNKLQLDILNILAKERNITVVGDMNQSIYRFRGAYKDNLELFKQYFQVTKDDMFTLAKSYRSPNTVLRTAHKIIAKNYKSEEEYFEVTNADNRDGDKIQVFELKNGKEEVRKIIEIIKSQLEKGRKPEEICIMFRTHQQANMLKRSLEHDNIPYYSAARMSLLKHSVIKQSINYLTILNAISNKGKNSVNAWWDLIHSSSFNGEDEMALLNFLRKNKNQESNMMNLDVNLSPEGKTLYDSIITRINSLMPCALKSVPEIIEQAYKLFNFSELEKTHEGRESLLALEEFKRIIAEQNNYEFFDLSSLLHHIEIMKALQIELDAPKVEEPGVKIMTAHATKGLEYLVVIIANLVQKKFPIEKIQSRPLIPAELMPELKQSLEKAPSYLKEDIRKDYEREQQIKDERRLCYVACTRAKDQLYLTYAQEYGGKQHSASQFLSEAQYKENSDISFEQDMEEKYHEPTAKIRPIIQSSVKKEIRFSPSSLKIFLECPKKYEYKYVLNMPDDRPPSWEAMKLGSFVHTIIEHGVRECFSNERSFILFAKEEALKEEWRSLELNEAILLLKVFFERNKHKYTASSRSEQHLQTTIDGIKFQGIADRIDFHPDGAEIIDYKTGFAQVPQQERNWQLGLYALAASEKYLVKRVTLDMLRQDRPLEFDLYEDGLAIERNTGRMSFSLQSVKQELVETAKLVLECYKKGFPACAIEKNCAFCDEHVWNR